MTEPYTELSRDTLFDGKVICWQPALGYRFSIDSVLLAHYASIKNNDKLLDIGTGCGILPLLLHYRNSYMVFTSVGLEKQRDLYDIAKKNILENKLEHSCQIVNGDIAEKKILFLPESFDRVIFNPPFYSKKSGRQSKDEQQRIARHQKEGSLEIFIEGAAYCVKNKGRIYCIYPVSGLVKLLALLSIHKLEPKKLQVVYPYPDQEKNGNLVLIEGVKNGGGELHIAPPLYIYQKKNGDYSTHVQEFYKP